MNDLLQPGPHPDADVLSAFAEHALPLHEQQQTLAHLAACADCRHLVFLAQQAEPVLLPEAALARAGWLAGWKLAWPVAGALAAAAVIAISLHKPAVIKPASAPVMVAINDATHEVASAPTALSPETKAMPAPLRKQPPVSGDALRGEPAAKPGIALDTAANAAVQAPSDEVTPQLPEAARGRGVSAGTLNQAVISQAAPPPPDVSEQSHFPVLRALRGQALASAGTPQPAPAAQTAAAPKSSVATAALGAAASPANFGPAPAALGRASTVNLANAALRSQPALPSHLATVTTVRIPRHTLALDTAGAIFRSDDAGVTWQAVLPAWSGRAVTLRLAPVAENVNVDDLSEGAAAPAAKAVPSQSFQIVTDSGIIWTSADGQTWTKQ